MILDIAPVSVRSSVQVLLLQQSAQRGGFMGCNGVQMEHQQHAYSWSWLLQVHHPVSDKLQWPP